MNPMSTMDGNIYNQQSYCAPVFHQTLVVHQQSYQALAVHQQSPTSFPQLDSGLAVPSFLPIDDLIASLNKAMAFISSTFALRYPTTNNQLETSSNPRNQATIQDGRITVQNVVVIRCYNCKGDGYFPRKCTQPKRAYNSEWFKEKMLPAQAQEAWVALNEEHLTFLVDIGERVDSGTDVRVLTTTAIFQSYDIDAFDSVCDEPLTEQAAFMANLSSYSSDVLFEEMSNQVAKCNAVNQENKTVNELLTAELERYKEMIKFFKERHKFDLNAHKKYIDSQMRGIIIDRNEKFADFQKQILTLKLQLSANVESHKNLSTPVNVLKKETKEKQDKYIEEIIDLEKKEKALENIVYKQAQRKQPVLYCDSALAKKHAPISVIDSKKTLDLAEATRLKMNEKQNDLIVKEKRVNITPIDYASLNKLYEHFPILLIVYPLFQLFKTLSLDESSSPEFDLFTDLEEHSKEEVAEKMVETMEEYMCNTRGDYGSGVTRSKIDDKYHFELNGQFLKKLRDNTFSGSDHEDANVHIEKVLEIVDLFHIPNITQD
ncbi:hypothetical protein Tco_1182109 [Tanacetum coccineum]